MVTMDLNAGYYWPHWPCGVSMISTEGPEALVVMGYRLWQYTNITFTCASSEAPTERPGGGEVVQVGGSARARPEMKTENRRRQCRR